MKFHETDLPGVVLIEPDVHRDDRGFFLESYSEERYREGGIEGRFVQDNHSRSVKSTLRGLHAQVERPQAKLVRVIEGEVYDDEGVYPCGSIVWMDVGTTHNPKTRGKTLILVLWPDGVKVA